MYIQLYIQKGLGHEVSFRPKPYFVGLVKLT